MIGTVVDTMDSRRVDDAAVAHRYRILLIEEIYDTAELVKTEHQRLLEKIRDARDAGVNYESIVRSVPWYSGVRQYLTALDVRDAADHALHLNCLKYAVEATVQASGILPRSGSAEAGVAYVGLYDSPGPKMTYEELAERVTGALTGAGLTIDGDVLSAFNGSDSVVVAFAPRES